MQRSTIEETLKKTGIMVIDGSMSTELEAMGCRLNDSLWTARVLAERPELVKRVHTNYFQAGADCGITCSYQATIPGYMRIGYTREEAEKFISRSVEIFREARGEWWQAEGRAQGRVWPLCLAGAGPYGAFLADGSEYRGAYDITDDELRRFHARRLELLWQAGADMLLLETQPSLREVLVEAELCEAMGADYWVSFSCRDGEHINDGTPIRACVEALPPEKFPHLKMLGVNCTPPVYVLSLIDALKSATKLPIAVYPNSGETYDPLTKTWCGKADALPFAEYALRYMQAGASAVGGCCTTVSSHIRDVAAARDKLLGSCGKGDA